MNGCHPCIRSVLLPMYPLDSVPSMVCALPLIDAERFPASSPCKGEE
jgi:hypothetical protein